MGHRTGPEAITCALESASFEDAVRNAISLGGDSDTLVAIRRRVACVAIHGIPEEIDATAGNAHLSNAPDIVEVMERLYEEGG